MIAQCRRKDVCVTRGSWPGRAVKDVQEQLDDGERDAQTYPPCPQHLKGCVGTGRAQPKELREFDSRA